MMRLLLLVAAGLLVLAGEPACARSVVLISLDGLRPGAILEAQKEGVVAPNLRRFVAQGAYARAVVGVTPAVTYPSHTTLVTGAWPSAHGIFANGAFDPSGANQGGLYWYSRDIRVPTLWQAVHAAGRVTASVAWPVTVNAPAIDYDLPDYERAQTEDDIKLMEALTQPRGYLEQLEARLGPYIKGAPNDVPSNDVRARFAIAILRNKKPAFLTLHLTTIDEESHQYGPFSRQAQAAITEMDRLVGEVTAAAQAVDPDAIVIVVSDHGFAAIDHVLNWPVAFQKAGLIGAKVNADGWLARLWNAGGSGAVMLHNPNDAALRRRVAAFLADLAKDPANGIARILTADEIRTQGGWAGASFAIAMRPGFLLSGGREGPQVEEAPGHGAHGYLPNVPEMNSAFFALGRGIAPGRDLGIVDMRQVAPTVARLLRVPFSSAALPPLDVEVGTKVRR